VVAVDVVPFDSVSVEVVQDCQTGLSALAIVGLTLARSSGERPVSESASGAVGGGDGGLIGGPEPTVDVLGEESGSVTSVEIAETARSPDVFDVVHLLLDPVVLIGGFERDQIHATFSAVVSGVEPVPFGASELGIIRLPGEPVVVVAITSGTGAVYSS